MLEIGSISNPLLYLWMRKNHDLIHPIESERIVNKYIRRVAICLITIATTLYFIKEMDEFFSTAILSIATITICIQFINIKFHNSHRIFLQDMADLERYISVDADSSERHTPKYGEFRLKELSGKYFKSMEKRDALESIKEAHETFVAFGMCDEDVEKYIPLPSHKSSD